MSRLRAALIGLLALCAGPCLALDPGASSGHYVREGARLEFSHAIALSQDNTEGMLDNGPQVRVLLSDREIPIDALYGAVFPPVRAMAQAGEVRGLLLEFDPADRTRIQVTVLDKPKEEGAFAPSISISNSEGLWEKLEAGAERVSGNYKSADDTDLEFTFSAPVFTDPVVADLKGPVAQQSEQVAVLMARAQAMGRGDLAAAKAASSRKSAAQLDAIPPAAMKMIAGQSAEAIKALKTSKRVVVRRATAIVMTPDGSFYSLVREDGAWKAAD